jgi:hypothetical protein
MPVAMERMEKRRASQSGEAVRGEIQKVSYCDSIRVLIMQK